jgi:hypothetical protein
LLGDIAPIFSGIDSENDIIIAFIFFFFDVKGILVLCFTPDGKERV